MSKFIEVFPGRVIHIDSITSISVFDRPNISNDIIVEIKFKDDYIEYACKDFKETKIMLQRIKDAMNSKEPFVEVELTHRLKNLQHRLEKQAYEDIYK